MSLSLCIVYTEFSDGDIMELAEDDFPEHYLKEIISENGDKTFIEVDGIALITNKKCTICKKPYHSNNVDDNITCCGSCYF